MDAAAANLPVPSPSHAVLAPNPIPPGGRRRGGYDCEFVEAPAAAFQTECPICLQVLKEPCVISCPCGQKICHECIEVIKAAGKPCPLCNNSDFTFIRDHGLERYLKEFEVFCTHKRDGCEWRGKLGELEAHLNQTPSPGSQESGCEFVAVECASLGCGQWFLHRQIENHKNHFCKFRPYSCKYCQYCSTFKGVTELHYGQCGSYPVSCPQNCSNKKFERQALSSHLNGDCPLVVVDCPFSFSGCKVRLPRKDLPEHAKQTELHLGLLASFTQGLLTENQELRQKIDQTDAALKQKLVSVQAVQKSEVKGLREEIGKLREQKMGLPVNFYIRRSEKRVVLPPFFTHSHGYKMRLEVTPNGEGDGAGTHVSVFAFFLDGQYNDQLRWPFRGEFVLKLVNQRGDHGHFEATLVYDDNTPIASSSVSHKGSPGEGWGYPKFIPHSSLGFNPSRNTQYLMDDFIVLRVVEVRIR